MGSLKDGLEEPRSAVWLQRGLAPGHPEEVLSVSFHSPKDTAWKQPLPRASCPDLLQLCLSGGGECAGSPRDSARLAPLFAEGFQPLGCVSGGAGAGELCGWWAGQPVSGYLAGFSKKHFEGQRRHVIIVIIVINA